MKLIIFILIAVLAGLQYKLWLGDDGFKSRRALENKIAQQESFNQKLIVRNQALEADVTELKQGAQALEEQARVEFGMIKNNELYYQFID